MELGPEWKTMTMDLNPVPKHDKDNKKYEEDEEKFWNRLPKTEWIKDPEYDIIDLDAAFNR